MNPNRQEVKVYKRAVAILFSVAAALVAGAVALMGRNELMAIWMLGMSFFLCIGTIPIICCIPKEPPPK